MNDILFYKSFGFKTISLTGFRHTDNSKGIDRHFIARMLSGRGRIVTDGKEELILEKGDVFYLPIGLRYHSYWYGDPDCNDRVAWESYGFTFIPDGSAGCYKMQKIAVDEESTELLDRLSRDMKVSPSSVGVLYTFCGKVFPDLIQTNSDPKAVMLERIRDYIAANPEFKVPDLAKHCGLSESGIYSFLKKYANTTPIEIKNRMKTEEAVAMLENTDLSVEEISRRLSFGNSAYFRKITKQYTGKTPTEIRKNAKII